MGDFDLEKVLLDRIREIKGMAYKAYVVYRDRIRRVYMTRSDCLLQVDGYKGSVYKGFMSIEKAYENYRMWVHSEELRREQPPRRDHDEDMKPNQPNHIREHSGEKTHYQIHETQVNDLWAFTRDLINAMLVLIITILILVILKLLRE